MKILDNLYAFIWENPTMNNCNSYFIDNEKKILVDPGFNNLFGHVRDALSKISISSQDIDMVIITHCHSDHMEGAKIFVGTSTLTAISKTEMDFIRNLTPHQREIHAFPDFEPDIMLQEGDLKIGHLMFQIIHTPGHSPGSICVYWPEKKVLFTGDVVFNQGIGRTDLPGCNSQKLKESIKKISRLEVEHLLTGHGEIVSGRELVERNFKRIEDF